MYGVYVTPSYLGAINAWLLKHDTGVDVDVDVDVYMPSWDGTTSILKAIWLRVAWTRTSADGFGPDTIAKPSQLTAPVTPFHSVSDSSGLSTNIYKLDIDTLSHKPVSVGDQFGPRFCINLLRFEVFITDDYSCQDHLIRDPNLESMFLSKDRTPVQGLFVGDHWAGCADFPPFPTPKGGISINQGKVVVYIEI